MNKVRTKSVKMRKQVNPRDICECTLAKDQHSISEEEAKWAGSSPENSDLSDMNKVKISLNNLLNL